MKVQYIQGRGTCERCGAYIKNIFVITFNDGYSITVGSECVKKVLRDTNLTEKGCSYVEMLMKPVERVRQLLVTWQKVTYEQAIKKKLLLRLWDDEAQAHRNQTVEEFEAKRKHMVEVWLPAKLKEREDEMNKILEEKGKKIHMKH
jgi:hypothetical protein